MEFAIDNNGIRVDAYDANEKKYYICPCCGNEVILRRGNLNIWHFAHKAGECSDTWNYDMSEWHHRMQGFFNKEYREVVIKNNDESHRADILKDGVVIEFQHSPISSYEFCKRNDFYINAGYRIAWIFDITEEWSSGSIFVLNDEQETKLRWRNPLRILQNGPIPQNNDKKISICISTTIDDEDGEESYYNINRVNWSSINDNEDPDYRYISINYDCCLELTNDMEMNQFFFTPKDFVEDYVKNFRPFRIKYKGRLKGRPKREYCCEITNDWIDRKTCDNCKHCFFRERFHISKDEMVDKFFCCYPRIVNKKIADGLVGIVDNEYQQVPCISH